MIFEHAHPYLHELDEAVWARIVAELLHSTTRAVAPRHAEQLMLGAGSGTLLFRVTGIATAGPDADVPWSVILKFLTHEPGLGEPSDADLGAWNYWKREWHVCRSGWLAELPGPFVAARCLATGELSRSDSLEVAWLALEDLAAWDVRPWPLEQFAETSRHVGLFHGAYLGGRPLPSNRWLSRHWLTGWVDQAADAIVRLPTVMDHPTLRTIYPTDAVDAVTEVWRSREHLYRALDALPQVLCHNDVFPRNVFARGVGTERQSIAIDWAFCGPGALGQEIATLVTGAQIFLECPPESWEELERGCLDGYLDGLRETGWPADPADVELGYLASYLLLVLGSIGPVSAMVLEPDLHNLVEAAFGRPFDEITPVWSAVSTFNRQRTERTWPLLEPAGWRHVGTARWRR